MRAVGALVRVLLWAVVLGIPLAGMWLASSMAALLNGPVWLTVLGGALLFPILPLAWDGFATWRKRKRVARRKSSSSFLDDLSSSKRSVPVPFIDRLMMRTLLLNALFLGGLLSQSPATAASALTARGDWMLDGVETPWVADARAVIFAIADTTERLAESEADNPYADLGDQTTPPPPPEAETAPRADITLRMPEGTHGRIQDSALTLTGTTSLPLSPGAYEMTVMLEDGRGLMCPITADWVGWQSPEPVLGLVAGEPWFLGPQACSQFQSPDPTWRPTLHLVRFRLPAEASHADAVPSALEGGESELVVLHEALVGADGITGVQLREPYVRIMLTPEAAQALCDATESDYLLHLAAVVAGEVRYETPVYEALCSGVVSLPMRAGMAQRGGIELADAVTDQEGGEHSRWQQHDTPHPLATSIPPELESSVQSVGQYFKDRIPDPFERTRAVHDYVVTRVIYDVVSLLPGQRAPQDADTVFRDHKGVCAGYANLMVALGQSAGLDIVYLIGKSRDEEGGVAGSMHAWNAVKLEGKWYLIDATWDAGSTGDDGFEADYKTDYLLTPPEIFRVTHMPSVDSWQLADPPITRGEFTRLPMLRPSFYASNLALIDIDRSQITTRDALDFRIANPEGRYLGVEVETASGQRKRCQVTAGTTTAIHCEFPGPGQHTVLLFHSNTPRGDYQFDGRLLVNVPG